MRLLVRLQQKDLAEKLVRVLAAEKIECKVRQSEDGHAVWIVNDSDLGRAQELETKFQADPDADIFRGLEQAGADWLKAEQQAEKIRQHKIVELKKRYRAGTGPLYATWTTTALCIFVSVITRFGDEYNDLYRFVFFGVLKSDGLRDIRPFLLVADGQLWRLITPAFLHLSIMHLVFNMMAFNYLGRIFESRHGPWRLLGLMLFVAVVSNSAQAWASGPSFGGLSGVVYGVFGYIWFRSKIDYQYSCRVDAQTANLFIVWLFLCLPLSWFTQMNVANTAHFAGMGSGMLLAFVIFKKSKFESLLE